MTARAILAMVGLAAVASAQPTAPAAEDAPFEVLHVRGNIYMFASALGNITVQVGKDPGHDGVLLVDTGPARTRERVLVELRKLSSEPISYILNTSADPDRSGGTEAVVRPSARPFYQQPTVAVFAQDNVLVRMSAPESGVPAAAWPSLTFEDRKDFEFNGETIQMFAEKNAHTDGDAIILFRGSNVVSVGDVFLTTGYPVIDLKRGGSIQGEINALNHMLELTVPHAMQEGGTMVIPGRGRLCDQSEVTDYRDMLTIIRDRVADLIAKRKTLDQAKAAKPTRDYDRRFSTSAWTGDMLVEAVYKSLSSKGPAK